LLKWSLDQPAQMVDSESELSGEVTVTAAFAKKRRWVSGEGLPLDVNR